MTTAHRPTFDPARGKEAARGPAYHQRLLPAHTYLKLRQTGQGGDADKHNQRDLRAELLEAERRYYAKKNGTPLPPLEANSTTDGASGEKRLHEALEEDLSDSEEAREKRRRIAVIEQYYEVDKSDSESSESSESEDEEEETTALMRELEKIKKERAEKKAKEDAERAEKEQEDREINIAKGNPLLNPHDFTMKRRWDDDVVFKNQARGTEDKKNKRKEYVNDMLRSDFHKKFMARYMK
ncbi:Cwf15/Cwc15 cell cycle control protein [Lindgomyces ingoldianus]|uniref:Cwf15/Cwc15 cell cycle control protein n=1 Tax=Lindgomyces ingoldianus TaxID=673940 RepID=A0ACB6RG45_9PLEO|nr:Cwf15/Cwc15 cell cycle control protein [Lindgomyces ingoldianus]KAF2477441.1 Cwf15/Cwc15 cell cycle control protein [Lindgomyces ingoldianus]